MNTRHKLPRFLLTAPLLLATAVALALAVPVAAESTAELLEKGIYTEQTVGDLKAAIEIYTQVIENDQANRPHVAQAQFRLGMCYLQEGRDKKAREALDKVIRDFPEHKRLVVQARERLAAVQPGLALGPVPWEDGEFLRYNMSLPTGKVLGSLYLTAHSTVVDGVDAWQLELRRFVANSSDNYGVSRILVDHQTQRPIRSTLRHGTLGNANATFGLDGVEITGGAVDSLVDSHRDIYDNDQSMHLTRMLPLELGYQAKINFLPLWTAKTIEVGLEVTGTKVLKVPAGNFETYKVEVDLGQTYWISTGPERYPVKIKAEGIIIELAEIGRIEPQAPVPFGLEDFGFSTTLPSGWFFHEYRSADRPDRAAVRFLDPEAATLSSVEVDRCPRGRCPTMQQTIERELKGAQGRIEDFKLREGSERERIIDGRPAISFAADFTRNGSPWVQYRLYTFTEEIRLEFIFRTPVDRFEELRATFDSVVESLKTE